MTRLYDCIAHQLQRFPKEDMLVSKENGQWKKYSTLQVQEMVNGLSAGLLALGLSAGDGSDEGSDKISIISNNRAEWLITDMAAQQIGLPVCPIYPTTNPAEIAFIFNDAQVKCVFVSTSDLYEKVMSIQAQVPSLLHIYTYTHISNAHHWSLLTQMATTELRQQVAAISASISDSFIATIIYTSGTTGTPKGVMLTHANIYSNVSNSKASFPFEDAPQQRILSFLPLNHIFEKCVSYIYLFSGIGIWYAESLETLVANMQEVQPDGFTTVPRLLEKVFEGIMQKGSQQTGIKKKLFYWAVSLGFRYDNQKSGGLLYNLQLALANTLIFSKWRAALGNRVKYIITGGAACQERLMRVFNAAKIPVYEGYGPTENSPVITINRKENGGTKYGTVGPPLKGQQVKLAHDGEIMVKGPSVMKGYYKRPDLTAEAVVDGWLLTGDIGVWVEEEKFLKITDRKKELFKTSGGKYVAPQPIENKMKESRYIEQIMIVGSERKFVGALIIPSFSNLKIWMQEKNIAFTTPQAAINQPEVQGLYKEVVEELNNNFNHVEQIKKFELLPTEWGIDSGEMTPKMSLKRKVILEKYKAVIEQMYA